MREKMIYSYEGFLDFIFETQEGRSVWNYKDFLIRMYGPNYADVMPASMIFTQKKQGYEMFEQTYDTS